MTFLVFAAVLLFALLGVSAVIVIATDLTHAISQRRRDRARRRTGLNLPGDRVVRARGRR